MGPLSGGTSWAVIVLVEVFAAFPADPARISLWVLAAVAWRVVCPVSCEVSGAGWSG